MKAAFVGLGSIGRRHLQNLHRIAKEQQLPLEVHAYRHSPIEESIPLVNKQYSCNLPQEEYDIVFITNPTSLHEESILNFQTHAKMLVIEKPAGIVPINEEKLLRDVIYYVNCPLRHSPVFELLLNTVSPKDVIAARAVCSSYLPDWRKGDYRSYYSAKAELGGGVELDLIHEMDYLITYFGYPQKITKIAAKLSDLEISSNDFAAYLLLYSDKAVELHLDYFGRSTKREIEIYTNQDTYTLDFVNKELRGSKTTIQAEDEDMYLREMRYVIALWQGRVENINSLGHANRVLSLSKM